MLYFFYGKDAVRRDKKARLFVEKTREKKPDAPFFEFDSESVTLDILEELSRAQGLFEKHNIAVLRGTLSLPEVSEFVAGNTAHLCDAATVFVFVEDDITEKTKESFRRHAQKIWDFPVKEGNAEKDTSLFAITDALGRRDRQSAWVGITKALLDGKEPESVHGLLFWQAKTMLAVKKAEKDGENEVKALKLNPFVLRKARAFVKNYSEEELAALSSDLVGMYHEARLGGDDLETALEKFALRM